MKKLGNTTKKGIEGKAPERGLTLKHIGGNGMSKFRISCSKENERLVYRVYFQGCTRHWYKTTSKKQAEQYIKTMKQLMKEDSEEIVPNCGL